MKMYGYYEPYQATGCVLSGEEFAYFLQKYTAKHPECDITEDTLNEIYLNEYDFERSDDAGFLTLPISVVMRQMECIYVHLH